MNNPIIRVVHVSKDFGVKNNSIIALNDVSCEINTGELVVILGASGSGKSTLLNLIGGLEKPTSGDIYFCDKKISKLRDNKLTNFRKNNIGFIFQSFNLIDELNVYDNVSITANKKNNKNIVEDSLSIVNLLEKKKKLPRQLSGGEQQRVSIARALAKDTDILLCDEPTGALDYETGKKILVELEKLARELHKTVIIVTHTKEISKIADRIITMRSGKISDIEYNDNIISALEVEW